MQERRLFLLSSPGRGDRIRGGVAKRRAATHFLSALLVCAAAVLIAPAAEAACRIEGYLVVCDPPPGRDGPGTLIVIGTEFFKSEKALESALSQQVDLDSLTSAQLEDLRRSLETVNAQIEADRLKIEQMRRTDGITMHDYRSSMRDYKRAIGQYKDGISLYRQHIR